MNKIISKLIKEHSLTLDEYQKLICGYNEELAAVLRDEAVRLRKEIYGNAVYIRGLIEISNICKNDCLYCGIRKSNSLCERYRLSSDEILESCDYGYTLGFRTFVLQGGEDGFFTDEYLCELVAKIKKKYPDCAVTLSLGERSEESYKKLFRAGADRYLLRHETADSDHYSKLHPENLTFENRISCLESLKKQAFRSVADLWWAHLTKLPKLSQRI